MESGERCRSCRASTKCMGRDQICSLPMHFVDALQPFSSLSAALCDTLLTAPVELANLVGVPLSEPQGTVLIHRNTPGITAIRHVRAIFKDVAITRIDLADQTDVCLGKPQFA